MGSYLNQIVDIERQAHANQNASYMNGPELQAHYIVTAITLLTDAVLTLAEIVERSTAD